MNTRTLDQHLAEYKQIDLDYAILTKQRTILKDKIVNLMKKNQMDSYSKKDYKVTRYETKRTMYIKAKLEELVDLPTLMQCSKEIISGGLRITYSKE